jgi:hypothetical protein
MKGVSLSLALRSAWPICFQAEWIISLLLDLARGRFELGPVIGEGR